MADRNLETTGLFFARPGVSYDVRDDPRVPGHPLPVARLLRDFTVRSGDRLEIGGLGIREWMPPYVVDRSQNPLGWMFMQFYQPMEVELDGRRRQIDGGSLVLWPPGASQYFGWLDGPWLHTWLHAYGQEVDALVEETGLADGGLVTDADPDWIERATLDLHHELTAHASPHRGIIRNALHTFLCQVARARQPEQTPIPPELIAVRRHLETHLTEPASLASLARLAKMTPNHFCTAFHRHIGVSPIEYLIRLRLEQARLLLRDRNRSIGEIAAAVGYEDPHYFAKLFRQRFGQPPSALR